MKTLLSALLVTATLASPAFAREVSGAEASQLMQALMKVGASSKAAGEMRRVSVSGVRCTTNLLRDGVFGNCDMDDDLSGEVIKSSDFHSRQKRPAAALAHAMSDAGIEGTRRAGGREMDAKKIECASVYLRGVHTTCKIRE